MSHDLVYTSAPQGLKPGSRGFCTVASTAGMAKNLTERLESFSGYRHAFMAHEAGGSQNPVNYAHYHTTVGGRKYHILSRIADAGLDYTQRSNKLAHHVALEPREAVAAPGGPAWVMADDGFFVERWDGQVRTLASGSQPVQSDRPPRVCQRWKELTGDAGWGGVLAESGLRKGGVMSVIFPAGTPVLELVVEALALVPPERRWQVTFSTYFTKAPAGVDCQWRFLLDGTSEATALRRDVRATVIDLCQPLGQAQSGDWVELARTGVLTQRSESRGTAPAQRVATVPPRMPSGPPARGAATDDVRLAPPVLPPSAAGSPVPTPDWLSSSHAASGRRWLLFGAGAVLLVALGLVLGAVLFSGGKTVAPVEIAETPVTPEPSEPSEPSEIVPEEAGDDPVDQEPTEEEPPEEMHDLPEVEPESEEPESDKPEEEQPPRDPFHDIRARQNRLHLPPTTVIKAGGALVGAFAKTPLNTEVVELAKIDVENNADLELQLGGSEFQPRRKKLKHYIKTVDEDTVRRWEIIVERPTGIETVTEERKLATFALQNGVLRFNWETTEPFFRLAYCTLTLTAHDKSETCHFEWEVAKEPSIQLKNETAERYNLPNIGRFLLRPDDDIFLELRFSGMPGARFAENPTRLTMQQNQTAIRIPLKPNDAKTNNPDVSVRLSFDCEKDEGYIIALWIESTTIGHAPTMNQTQELVAAQWNREHWKRGEKWIDLSDEGINTHFASQGEKLEGELKRFETFLERKTTFKRIGKWVQEPRELQVIAVESFAELERTVTQLQATLDLLNQNHAQLETLFQETSFPDAKADLMNRIQQNRQQAKEPTDRLDKLSIKRKNLIANQPRLPDVYNYYKLSEPSHVERARIHLFFRDYLDEVKIWYDAMNRFVKDLRNKSRLDYRLSMTVEGRKIDLLVTEGFPDQPSDAGDAN